MTQVYDGCRYCREDEDDEPKDVKDGVGEIVENSQGGGQVVHH